MPMAVLKKRHLNMMKNIFYLVLMLTFSLKGFGQEPTYSMKVETIRYDRIESSFTWQIYGNAGFSVTDNTTFEFPYNEKFTSVSFKNNLFTFYLTGGFPIIYTDGVACNSCEVFQEECSFRQTSYIITAPELIQSGYYFYSGACSGYAGITDFKPNVTIRKQNDPSNSTICSGFTLDLGGFPKGFPDEAYHWQYSFDGVSNWVDVPVKNASIVKFTIQDILGDTHVNHFDKPIYFRLGYGQDRPFTEPLAITYSSCAPVAEEVVYVPPRCNGDAVNSIEVYFDRELDEDKNENLYPIYVANKMDKTQQFFQAKKPVESLVFDPIKGRYKYSFTNLATLVQGDSYVVVYQARIGEFPRGVLTTSSKGFTYKDPEKLEFVITKQTPPSCFGGEDGSIEIMVTSGVPLYRFYKDEVELKDQLYPTLKDGKYHILGLKANPEGYKIKVTDANGCIEKTTP
jgi:hypothetical protein